MLSLLPAPRSLTLGDGSLVLQPNGLIVFEGAPAAELAFGARRVQRAISEHAGLSWELSASGAVPAEQIGAHLRVASEAIPHPQGYTLRIGAEGIAVAAHDTAGAFYACCTLAQIVAASGAALPFLEIADWPDFAVRGVMLDVSRDKVPTADRAGTRANGATAAARLQAGAAGATRRKPRRSRRPARARRRHARHHRGIRAGVAGAQPSRRPARQRSTPAARPRRLWRRITQAARRGLPRRRATRSARSETHRGAPRGRRCSWKP